MKRRLLTWIMVIGALWLAMVPTTYALSEADERAIYRNTVHYKQNSGSVVCGGGITTPGNAAPKNGSTYILGDSISSGLHAYGLEDKLSSKTGGATTINHDSGRSITRPGTEVKSSALDAVRNDTATIANAGTIVVVLGTNPTDDPFEENLRVLITSLKAINDDARYFWVDIGATRADTAAVWSTRNKVIYDNANGQGYGVISRYKALFGQDKDPLNIQPGVQLPGSSDFVHGGNQQLADEIIKQLTTSGGNTSTGCACVPLLGGDNPEKIYNYFIGKGLTPEQTVGIMGNIQSESAGTWDPRVVEYAFSDPPHRSDTIPPDVNSRGQPGYGLVQWTGGRKRTLQAFIDGKGLPHSDLGAQLDFIWHELNTAYKARVLDVILAATGPDALEVSTNIFLEKYEVPADIPGTRPGRINNARALLARFGSGSGSTGAASC